MYHEMMEKLLEVIRLLKPEKNYTIVGYDEFGFPNHEHVYLLSATMERYAQYPNVLVLRYLSKFGLDVRELFVMPYQHVAIFEDHVSVLTESYVKETVTSSGLTIREGLTCFHPEYMQRALGSTDRTPLLHYVRGEELYVDGVLYGRAEEVTDIVYEIVSQDGVLELSREELLRRFALVGTTDNPVLHKKLRGQPILRGLSGPMNGRDNRVRYESSMTLARVAD